MSAVMEVVSVVAGTMVAAGLFAEYLSNRIDARGRMPLSNDDPIPPAKIESLPDDPDER